MMLRMKNLVEICTLPVSSAKKAEDTYNLFWKEEQAKIVRLRWRSGGYTTVDLTGYYKPTKNLTLQLGAYNLTNKNI